MWCQLTAYFESDEKMKQRAAHENKHLNRAPSKNVSSTSGIEIKKPEWFKSVEVFFFVAGN
jgi:hypothetical protein